MAPLGISFFFTSPAPLGNEVRFGGILNTTQCHHPLPVGASGSYMVTAKLLVPLGAPFQLNAGDALPPVQPKPLNTCSLAMVLPSLISELVKVMLCAFAALEPSRPMPSNAIQGTTFATASPPSRYAEIVWFSRCYHEQYQFLGLPGSKRARKP